MLASDGWSRALRVRDLRTRRSRPELVHRRGTRVFSRRTVARGVAAGGPCQLSRYLRQPDQAPERRRAGSRPLSHRSRRRRPRRGRSRGCRRRIEPARHVANRAVQGYRVRRVRTTRVRHGDAEAVVGRDATEQPPRRAPAPPTRTRGVGSVQVPGQAERFEGPARRHARGHGGPRRVRHRVRGGQVRQPGVVRGPQAPGRRRGTRGRHLPERRFWRRNIRSILRRPRTKRQLHPPRHPRGPNRVRLPAEPAGGRREDGPDAVYRTRRRLGGYPRGRTVQGFDGGARRVRQLVPRRRRPGHGPPLGPRGQRGRRRRGLRRR